MKSQTVMSFIAKGAFGILMICLIVLNASYGLRFITRIFPDNVVIQWASLIVFDVGALAWFMVFLYMAEGTAQRGTSLVGAGLDLLGAGLIAFAEVFTSGSAFVALDQGTVEWLQVIVTYAIPLWTMGNVVLTYIFHVSSPAMTQQIRAREAQDKILEQSFHLLNRKMGAMSQGLADRMSEEMVGNILQEMRIPNLPARGGRPKKEMAALPEILETTDERGGGVRPFVRSAADLEEVQEDEIQEGQRVRYSKKKMNGHRLS